MENAKKPRRRWAEAQAAAGEAEYLVRANLMYYKDKQKGVIPLLKYKNSIESKNRTILSVDNIVIDLYLSNYLHRDQFMKMLDQLPMRNAVEVQHWTNFRIGTYREQFSIRMPDNTSFWVGAALNLAKTNWGKMRIEFNPNKVGDSAVFQEILVFLVSHTRPMHRVIRRFDLAIDLPIDRMSVYLVKDARAYFERRHGRELTQYLGPRSAHGHVKVYNKQLESKLDFPLTRVEITLDPAVSYEKINFPTVYYLDNMQMQMDELKATDTERFILNAILQGYGTTKQLGRKTREKIERLMGQYVKYVEVSAKEYRQIMDQLQEYTVGYYDSGADTVLPIPVKIPTQSVTGFQEIETDKLASPF